MKIDIEIQIDNVWGKDYLTKTEIKRIIKIILKYLLKSQQLKKIKQIFININFVNEKTIQDYNNTFRAKDMSTNVLSFTKYKNFNDFILDLDNSYIYMGDVVLCFEKLQQESIEYNIRFKKRLYHLFVHSILHLLGFEHIEESDRIIMENIEIDILKNFNIINPYLY